MTKKTQYRVIIEVFEAVDFDDRTYWEFISPLFDDEFEAKELAELLNENAVAGPDIDLNVFIQPYEV